MTAAPSTNRTFKNSVFQFRLFIKVWATKFLTKVAQMVGNFFGILKKALCKSNLLWLFFGKRLDKIGLLFKHLKIGSHCSSYKVFNGLVQLV